MSHKAIISTIFVEDIYRKQNHVDDGKLKGKILRFRNLNKESCFRSLIKNLIL